MSDQAADLSRGEQRELRAPVLQVRDLCAGYGPIRVLESVSIDVGAEEVVAVLGANGVGKTTLMRSIAGVIPSRSGSVSFMGRNTTGLPAHSLVREGIGHVSNSRDLFPDLSVEQNLALGAYGVDRRRRQELFERTLDLFPKLGEIPRRRAGSLSGGEQQMVAIGRALMTDPRLLLLDEPSTGLAPAIVGTLFEALRRLIRQTDLSLVIIEQNTSMALALAERLYVLRQGEVVLSGSCSEITEERLVESYLG